MIARLFAVLLLTIPGVALAQMFFPPPLNVSVPTTPVSQSSICSSAFPDTSAPSLSCNLGAPGKARVIAVLVNFLTASSFTINSVTVAGVSATFRARSLFASNFATIELWTATIPAAITGTQTITASITDGAVSRGEIQVLQILNAHAEAPDFTAVVNNGSSPVSTTIQVPANGAAIGGVLGGNNITSWSWSGLTTWGDGPIIPGQQVSSYAGADFAAAQSPLTVTATANTTPSSGSTLLLASWGP